MVDWMARSSFRRGATTTLGLGLVHFPGDVTSGYALATGSVDITEVLRLFTKATLFAERMLVMVDLPYQETMVAPGDSEPEHRD
ncbi:hypothetical protein, partial [Pseudomonas helleri]|uniref:hypothetical protein n=1 Tax=Pseudomonas helleri TaxID=1608996 RepID=UPI001E573791